MCMKQSPNYVGLDHQPHIPAGEDLEPATLDPSIDKWFFISDST